MNFDDFLQFMKKKMHPEFSDDDILDAFKVKNFYKLTRMYSTVYVTENLLAEIAQSQKVKTSVLIEINQAVASQA